MNKKSKSIAILFLMVFLVCSVYLVVVSSGETASKDTNNAKVFTKDATTSTYGKIDIKDFYGLGNTLATYELTYNTDQCLINCSAEGTVNMIEKGVLFEDLNFKNKFGDLLSLRDVSKYILEDVSYTRNVSVFKDVCEDQNINSTIINVCNPINNGVKEETFTKKEWVEYKGQELQGNYTWRIEAIKSPKESVDWIPTAKGLTLDNWAWWNTGWGSCQNLSLDLPSALGSDSIFTYNITGLTFQNITEIRIVDQSCWADGSELDSSVLSNNTNWAVVTFFANLTGGTNYSVYYNNPTNPAKTTEAVTDFCEFGSEDGSVCGWNNVTAVGYITPEGTLNMTATSGFNSWTGFISPIDNAFVGTITSRFNFKTMGDAYIYFGLTNGQGTDMANGAHYVGTFIDTRNTYKEIALYITGGDEVASVTPANITYTQALTHLSNGTSIMSMGNDSGTPLSTVSSIHDMTDTNFSLCVGASASTWNGAIMFDYLRAYNRVSNYVGDSDLPILTQGDEENYTVSDTEYPQFSNYVINLANNSAYLNGFVYEFNATITSTNTTIGLEFNGVNYTDLENLSAIFNATISGLSVGDYTYYWWAYGNGSSNLYNTSETLDYSISKADPTGGLSLSGTTPISYPQVTDVSGSETNTGDGGCSYAVDNSNIVYGVGTVIFNYSTTGCTNYTQGSKTLEITIEQNNTYVLGLSGTSPIEYPATTDFTGSGCPTELTCTLNISNGVYGAGVIWANYSTAGNTNYSANSITNSITINKNSSYVLSITGTTPLSYPNPTDVAGGDCPSELSCSLNNGNIVYGVDASPVTFNYSTPGNDNYTAGSITTDITITQNDTYVLAITKTSPIDYLTTTDFNGADCPSELSCSLNISNEVYGAGTIYANYSTAGNVNYSANSIVDSIDINKIVPQGSITGTTPITYLTASDVLGSESNTGDGDVSYTLVRDNITIINPDNEVLGAGVYEYVYNATGGENYTDNNSIGTFTLTINKNDGVCNIYFNDTSPLNYKIPFKVYTDCTSDFYIIRNNTYIDNNSQQDLGASTYNFTVFRNDTANYTYLSDEDSFTINPISSSVYMYLDNARSDKTIENGTAIDINATLITGEDIITIYMDDVVYNQGTTALFNNTNFTDAEVYHNFTAYYEATQNYTASFDVFFLNVTKSALEDNITPELTVYSPYELQEFYKSSTQSIDIAPLFYINDTNLDNCWYNLSGLNNVADTNLSCVNDENNSFSFTIHEPDNYLIKICVNDSLGNENCSEVNFSVGNSETSYGSPNSGGSSTTTYTVINETNITSINESLEGNLTIKEKIDISTSFLTRRLINNWFIIGLLLIPLMILIIVIIKKSNKKKKENK